MAHKLMKKRIVKAARKTAKHTARKVARKTPRNRPTAAQARPIQDAPRPNAEELRNSIMVLVRQLIDATAMNNGLVPDNEMKLAIIDNTLRNALGLPPL